MSTEVEKANACISCRTKIRAFRSVCQECLDEYVEREAEDLMQAGFSRPVALHKK